jgi:hypothetical protein
MFPLTLFAFTSDDVDVLGFDVSLHGNNISRVHPWASTVLGFYRV